MTNYNYQQQQQYQQPPPSSGNNQQQFHQTSPTSVQYVSTNTTQQQQYQQQPSFYPSSTTTPPLISGGPPLQINGVVNNNNNNNNSNQIIMSSTTTSVHHQHALPPIPQQFLDHYCMVQDSLNQLTVFIPQYNTQTNTVNMLQQQVNNQQQVLNNLSNDVKKEKNQVEKLQKSSFTNLISKTFDKHGHDKKVDKENSEYKMALDRENQARTQLLTLQNQLVQAQSAQSSLLQKVQLYESKKMELNQVADQIIGAAQLPLSHSIPVTHQNLNVQQSKKNQIVQYLTQYRNGLMNLQQAHSLLQSCYERLSEAKTLATADLFMRGGVANMYVDSMKYENLNRANDDAKRAKLFISEAVRLCPPLATQPLFVAKVTQGDFVFDVFFDNVISDYIVHEKIRKSKEAMAESITHLCNTLNWIQTACLPQIERDLSETDRQVLSLSITLENERRNIINQAFGQSQQQPPQNFTQVVLPPPQNPSTLPNNMLPPPNNNNVTTTQQYPNVVQYSSAPSLHH